MGTRRNMTGHDSQSLNIDLNTFTSIKGMKMGRVVVREVNLDDDTVKTADVRHGPPLGARKETDLPEFCP